MGEMTQNTELERGRANHTHTHRRHQVQPGVQEASTSPRPPLAGENPMHSGSHTTGLTCNLPCSRRDFQCQSNIRRACVLPGQRAARSHGHLMSQRKLLQFEISTCPHQEVPGASAGWSLVRPWEGTPHVGSLVCKCPGMVLQCAVMQLEDPSGRGARAPLEPISAKASLTNEQWRKWL